MWKADKMSPIRQETLNLWIGQQKYVSKKASIEQRLSDWNGKKVAIGIYCSGYNSILCRFGRVGLKDVKLWLNCDGFPK
jgi:hypothetical protein